MVLTYFLNDFEMVPVAPIITGITLVIIIIIIIIIIFSGTAAQHGLSPPRPRGFLITQNDAPQSVGLLWTSDQLVAETST
jgi:amino acid transporter